jgi:hypothetical protein
MDALLENIASRFSSGRWDDLDVQFLLKMAHVAASEAGVTAATIVSSFEELRARREHLRSEYLKERGRNGIHARIR